jgi:hypothetical protein
MGPRSGSSVPSGDLGRVLVVSPMTMAAAWCARTRLAHLALPVLGLTLLRAGVADFPRVRRARPR